MATVVVQSYRTQDVPAWLKLCMASVQRWAQHAGYSYCFVDDSLFDRVPAGLHATRPHSLLPWTDLARLAVMREQLATDYTRAVWIDADVLIFQPDTFALPKGGAFACRELWMDVDTQGRWHQQNRINNAILAFERGHPLLDFLHHACLERLAHIPPSQLRSTSLGTDLLTQLGTLYPIKLIQHVGCFSPALLIALARGRQAPLQSYAKAFGQPLHAANLCRSKLMSRGSGRSRMESFEDTDIERAVSILTAWSGTSVSLAETTTMA